MSSNKLKLNSDKTHLMHFSSNRPRADNDQNNAIQLNTGNEIINVSQSEKLLGSIVNCDLRWDEHLLHHSDALLKQLSQRLSAIKLICNIADFKTRKMVTNGLFMSKLTYLMPLWGGCPKYLVNALQVMQNKAARYVTKQNVYTPVKSLLLQCDWLSVQQMIFFHTVVLFYRTRERGLPVQLFKMASSDYNYNTRQKANGNYKVLSNIRRPSTLAMRSYRWRSVEWWNLLPLEIKCEKNVVHFKKSLKVWIRQNINITP